MSGLPAVVLGAGPAGLAAAEAISAHGGQVILVDDNGAPGGQVWRGGPGRWRDRQADALWRALQSRPNVTWLGATRAVASAGPGMLLLDGEGGTRQLAWERAVICTGARELLLPFPGWTLPGVTGAGGMQALLKGGMPVGGKRVLVAGSGPLLLAVADTVRRRHGQVVAIAEHRGTGELAVFAARLALSQRAKLLQSLRLMGALAGVSYLHDATVVAAIGDSRLRSVVLRQRGRETEVACDYLACGYGLVPALESAALFGCATEAGRVRVDEAQRTSVGGVWAAGESTGIGGVDKALAEGRIAGLEAVGRGASAAELAARRRAQAFGALLARSFAPTPALRALCRPDTIVCRCEDVRAAQLTPHAGWRSAKLQTRVGMGPCQGRVCGCACEFLYGWEAPGLRQPVFPTNAGVLAQVGRGRIS